jgi:hypothetical protein
MRWILTTCLICFILPFLWHAGLARNDGCPSSMDVRVTVKTVSGDPVYDFSFDVPAIQLLANDAVHKVRQGWALGLTRYKPVLEMSAPVEITPLPNGLYCARPRYVNITVGYKDVAVIIPSELSGDSCGFKEILKHEGKHLAAGQQMLKKFAPLIGEKLVGYLKLNGNVREANPDDAATLMQNMLRAPLDEIAEQMSVENNALQQDVDSPEEYHRLLGSCDGELADLVKQVRGEQQLARQF